MPVPGGIPQGSVLSCTCFMVAINSITGSLTHDVKSALYVDDFTTYASGHFTHLNERRIQVVINRLQIWCNETGFVFSPSKTVAMHICCKKNCPKVAHGLSLNDDKSHVLMNRSILV